MSDRIKYSLIAIGSFLIGIILYTSKNKNKTPLVDEDFNKTLAKQKDGRFFLVFNNIVVLSREITSEQYDNFLKQYPTGKAQGNVINQFSTPTTKYTVENNKYYEYKWTDNGYSSPMEITKEEYDFLTKKNLFPEYINI